MRWAMPKRYYFESTRRSRRGVLKKYLVRPTELKAAGGRFGPLLAWAREHLDTPLTVEDLAEQAGVSSRHFARAFIAETGTTPSKAVERLRIEVARQRVQSSGEAIERVAKSTGFRDPERMRSAFIRAFGQPPQSLRRAARAG